jgi:hypothetical protein
MGRPLHLQIGFDPSHQVLHMATSCGYAKSCMSPVGATHDNSLGGAKSCLLRGGATHGCSYGGAKSCMVMFDRRWCDSDRR